MTTDKVKLSIMRIGEKEKNHYVVKDLSAAQN
jgi:hypothetical protein